MLKPLRQHRKEILEREGFLPAEAKALSRNKLGSPAMKELRRERKIMLRHAQSIYVKEVKKKPLKKGIDPVAYFYRQWSSKIKNLYAVNKWIDNNGKLNYFARLREISDAFKYQHPDFRTPQPKKKDRVTPGEYQKRAEKTRKYTVTVTYEIAAGSQKEAEQQAMRQVKNVKRIKVSEID